MSYEVKLESFSLLMLERVLYSKPMTVYPEALKHSHLLSYEEQKASQSDNERENELERRTEKQFAIISAFPRATQISRLQLLPSKRGTGLSATGSNWVHVYVLGREK